MKVLFMGDIVGKSGRRIISEKLPDLIKQKKIDFVIANGENLAHGFGFHQKQCEDLFKIGIDCFTGGNHSFRKRESFHFMENDTRIIRPLNFPVDSIGRGFQIFEVKGKKILVINLIGQVSMALNDSPFSAVKQLLKSYKLKQNIDIIFIDFHAEATGEKMGMGHFLDGSVSVIAGSHTHIPTSDFHILEKGSGYISDAGMCGDYNSMIGMEKQNALHKLISKIPGEPFTPASGQGTFMGTLFDINDKGLVSAVEQIKIGGYLDRTKL